MTLHPPNSLFKAKREKRKERKKERERISALRAAGAESAVVATADENE